MGVRLITAPTVEPIDAAFAAKVGRLSSVSDLVLLEECLSPARSFVELATKRALLDQTWELVLPAFPCGPIELPKPPLIAIVSVSYVDTASVTRTLAATTGYVLESMSGGTYKTDAPMPARLHQPDGVPWPSTATTPEAVVIRYRAGYGTTPTDVPATLRLAVAQRAAQLFENALDDEGLLGLLSPYRVWTFA